MTRLHKPARHLRCFVPFVALLATAILSAPARAQSVIPNEAAEAMKAPFIADLEEMKTKFVQLAGAFPDDKMAWRPMDGVRSVAEVLALIASELNGIIPEGFGGKAGVPREQIQTLRTSTNKTELIAAINKAFDHAKAQIAAGDPATLARRRTIGSQERSLYEFVLLIGGDMHEHLGQLIAYARMNKVVPPWSK